MIKVHIISEYGMIGSGRKVSTIHSVRVAYKQIDMPEIPKEGDSIFIDEPIFEFGNDAFDMTEIISGVCPGHGCIEVAIHGAYFEDGDDLARYEKTIQEDGWTTVDKIHYPTGRNLTEKSDQNK